MLKLNRDGLLRSLYKQDLYEFFKFCWKLIEGSELKESEHIKVIARKLQEVGFRVIKGEDKLHTYYLFNLPPGSGKSRLISIVFPVWLWLHRQNLVIISGSYAMDIATNFSIKSRDLMLNSKFQELFNIEFKSDQNNKTHYVNTNLGERFTVSTGSAVTGNHADILIVDDPLNSQDSISATEIETANKWVSETLSSRKKEPSKVPTIIIQQRMHQEDTTGFLIERGVDYELMCLPAELDDNVHPPELREIYKDGLLHPERLSKEVLEEKKIELGTIKYATQYGQRPAPAGGSILKPDWFRFISVEEFNRLHKNVTWDGDLDSAYGNSNKADPSGFLASTLIGNVTYIRYAEEKNLTFPELKKYMAVFAERNGFTSKSRFYVEPKASGISVVQDLMESKMNVVQFDAPKESKVLRATGTSAYQESGKVVIVGSPSDSWVKKFLAQIEVFPNSKFDNMVDVLVQACLRGMRATTGRTKFTIHKNPWNRDTPQQKVRDLFR